MADFAGALLAARSKAASRSELFAVDGSTFSADLPLPVNTLHHNYRIFAHNRAVAGRKGGELESGRPRPFVPKRSVERRPA